MLPAQRLGLLGRQPTMSVRPWHDAQWTALGATVVEMRAHGDERLQQAGGWLGVENALLLGPAVALGMRDLLMNGDAEVLVESDEPVGFRRLVEQGALHGHGCRRKQRRDRRVRPECHREVLAAGQIEEIAGSGPPAARRVEGGRHVGANFWTQNVWNLGQAHVVERREGQHAATEGGPGLEPRETPSAMCRRTRPPAASGSRHCPDRFTRMASQRQVSEAPTRSGTMVTVVMRSPLQWGLAVTSSRPTAKSSPATMSA